MAEQKFAEVSEFGLSVSTLTGASGALFNIYALGQQFGGASSTRKLLVNHQNVLVHEGVDHSARRGLNLTIFDSNMKVTYMATFDVYGTVDNNSNALATRLNSMTAGELGVLTSYDAINSNATLDAAMRSFRSSAWPGVEYFSQNFPNTGARRVSYCAILCGRKHAVVAEKFIGHAAPTSDAIIEIAFANTANIGYAGFARPIFSEHETIESTGINELVHTYASDTLANLNLRVGDDFIFKVLAEINEISAASKTYLNVEVLYQNAAGATLSSLTHKVKSVEGWEIVELRGTIPANTVKLTVQVRKLREEAGNPEGTQYLKNAIFSLADNNEARTTAVSIGVYGTAAKDFGDSLGGFIQYNPKSYYEAYYSERNLLRNQNLMQSAYEDVRWMDRVLTKQNEKIAIKIGIGYSQTFGPVEIDPSKWYYFCIWANKKFQHAGQIKVGFTQLNSSSTAVPIYATDRSTSGTRLYCQTPSVDMLEDRQWYLINGFILPHNISTTRAIEFIEANKEFYGWDDIYGTGIGVSDEGTGNYGCISNSAAKSMSFYLEHTGSTQTINAAWALPILREIPTGTIDVDDGILVSTSISG